MVEATGISVFCSTVASYGLPDRLLSLNSGQLRYSLIQKAAIIVRNFGSRTLSSTRVTRKYYQEVCSLPERKHTTHVIFCQGERENEKKYGEFFAVKGLPDLG